jgi:hypothetical protein
MKIFRASRYVESNEMRIEDSPWGRVGKEKACLTVFTKLRKFSQLRIIPIRWTECAELPNVKERIWKDITTQKRGRQAETLLAFLRNSITWVRCVLQSVSTQLSGISSCPSPVLKTRHMEMGGASFIRQVVLLWWCRAAVFFPQSCSSLLAVSSTTHYLEIIRFCREIFYIAFEILPWR